MADKALISELTWRSLESQKKAFPNLPHYIAPDDLPSLLRPTRRNSRDRILVLSLAVISDKEKDFINFIREARKKNMSVYASEEFTEYAPNCEFEVYIEAWRKSRKSGSAKIGGKMSADIKKAKSAIGIAKIKDRWPMPSKEWPTSVLLDEAGISLNTAKSVLGRRPIEQANYQAKLKRQEKKAIKLRK